MNAAIALPERKILVPPLEFPRWLRFPRGVSDERVAKMLASLGGMLTPLGVSGVAANWWQAGGAPGCVAAYQPKGAASLAASLVNLTGGSNATTGAEPTVNTATGWGLDGLTQYIIVPFIFLPGWSMFIQFSDVGATGALVICGASDSTNRSMLAPTRAAESATYYYGTGNQSVSPQKTSGNLALVGDIGYRDGVADTTSIGSFSATHGLTAFIGCVNANGVPLLHLSCNVQAFAMYSTTLSSGQAAAVAAAMAAL